MSPRISKDLNCDLNIYFAENLEDVMTWVEYHNQIYPRYHSHKFQIIQNGIISSRIKYLNKRILLYLMILSKKRMMTMTAVGH
jgi:hypothetical protein